MSSTSVRSRGTGWSAEHQARDLLLGRHPFQLPHGKAPPVTVVRVESEVVVVMGERNLELELVGRHRLFTYGTADVDAGSAHTRLGKTARQRLSADHSASGVGRGAGAPWPAATLAGAIAELG